MRFELTSVFQFLPTEVVKASELKRGDVAYVHKRWELVIANIDNGPKANNGWSREISGLSGGASYLPPDLDVTIVQRDLFNSAKLEKFIEEHLMEKERHRKLAEQEEQEEIEREKDYLRARLRDLEDE